jgi:Sulfotransferase domain
MAEPASSAAGDVGGGSARQAAEAWCLLGQQLRSRGRQRQAARAFLRALRRHDDCQSALRALDFHRFSDDDLRALLPELDRLVRSGICRQPRAQLVLADWHHQVGDRALARRFYQGLLAAGEAGEEDDPDRRPDALVIGAPKCGTTSLMAYLGNHPQLWCQPRKELHFFNNRWDWGMAWYRQQFPCRRATAGKVRLEATPDYLQAPQIAERVAATLPGVKLIVLLREPLARALSWYHHQRRWAGLAGSAEEVIGRELEALERLPAGELEALGWRAPNCLAGSLYDLQLRSWTLRFPPENLLMVSFEQLCSHPAHTLRTLLNFLDLSPTSAFRDQPFPLLNSSPLPYPKLAPGLAQHCRHTILRGALKLWCQL